MAAVVTGVSLPDPPSHAADSYCQECVLQIASQALEFRAAGSVDIIPSSLSLPFDQVMHLYLNSPIPIASSYFHKIYEGKSVAFMLLFTANLVDFSFMEFMLFPKFPLVSSGIVAGSLMSIATNAPMFVLFKGSAIRCIVTSAFIADFRIDILAQCAVPISGVGLPNVADNTQLDFPLLSITEVECRRPLFIFSVLSFRFVIIYAIYVFRLAITAAALLYLSLNICS
ncbi:hypothetical protein F2Q68_00038036 [Brassica cretica]|uniref:Uncharacterized protein n=1 Tax=Brassica cretica TaxID=69181 RepID=A0A8S9H5H1_BRACR|nr:hypothetical protein F2Q68_00038036 [Brassica cretica]